jgi:hypothetical protein
MATGQRTFTLVPTTPNPVAAGAKRRLPPMTSKEAQKRYRQQTRTKRVSKAEERRLEKEEQDRIKKEYEKEKAQAKARAAREKKRLKEEAERDEKRKDGQPITECRPSQPTISRFARRGLPYSRASAVVKLWPFVVVEEENEAAADSHPNITSPMHTPEPSRTTSPVQSRGLERSREDQESPEHATTPDRPRWQSNRVQPSQRAAVASHAPSSPMIARDHQPDLEEVEQSRYQLRKRHATPPPLPMSTQAFLHGHFDSLFPSFSQQARELEEEHTGDAEGNTPRKDLARDDAARRPSSELGSPPLALSQDWDFSSQDLKELDECVARACSQTPRPSISTRDPLISNQSVGNAALGKVAATKTAVAFGPVMRPPMISVISMPPPQSLHGPNKLDRPSGLEKRPGSRIPNRFFSSSGTHETMVMAVSRSKKTAELEDISRRSRDQLHSVRPLPTKTANSPLKNQAGALQGSLTPTRPVQCVVEFDERAETLGASGSQETDYGELLPDDVALVDQLVDFG